MNGFYRTRSTASRLVFAAVLGFFAMAASAEEVKDLPQPTDYVSDFANVLSAQTIAQLDSICNQLDHSATNAQLAVVTVHNLNGDDAADFANALEDHWKMGNKGLNRYAMVLLAVDDHKYRIEIGYGLEGILPDGKTGDIGRGMVPYLRAKDYDSAILLAAGQVAQVIADDAKVTLDNAPAVAPAPTESRSRGGFPIPILFFLAFFVISIVVRIVHAIGAALGLWPHWPRYMGPSGGGGFMMGGFGGGGGGGGGFGGFGGGGGGFGGGGAGGSW